MKSKTASILAVMNVLAWITFVGLMVKAGAILISYGVALGNPEGSKNLYNGLNLFPLRQFDFWHYTTMTSWLIAIALLEAYVAFLLIRILSKIKMSHPFTIEISNLLERMSYYILVIWVVAMLFNAHLKWLSKKIPTLEAHYVSGEFIFLAGVVFVIAQVFKKGVEIQTENELTV